MRCLLTPCLLSLGLSGLLQAGTISEPNPIGLGLGGFSYWASGPFADTAKTADAWLEFDTNWGSERYFFNEDGTANPQFNTRGLPNYLNPGKKLRLLLWPYSQAGRNITQVGKWVVTWEGDADIRLRGGATFVADESSGPSTGRLVNGRRVYLVEANDVGGHLTVEAIHTPVTDLKVWLPDPADPQNRSLEGSSSMWHPSFLSHVNSHPFNHLRFMDWGETNASPQQDWADRRRPERMGQHGILNRRSPAPGVVAWTDSSGDPVYFDGNRGTGIAYEYMIDLANTTGKDMWICVPHLATDDYVRKLANLIRYGSDGSEPYTSPQTNPVFAPLDPGLRVYVEFSNEIWSGGNSFPQGNWAVAQANALGISRPVFNARRFSQIWRIFQEVFGGEERVVRVAAIHTANASYSDDFLAELAGYGPTLSPAVRPDFVSPTTYFGNGIQDWAYEQANLAAGTANQWFHTDDTFIHNNSTGATRPVSVPIDDPYWSSPALADQQAATFREWKKRIFSGSAAEGGGPDATGGGGGFDADLSQRVWDIFEEHLPLISYEGGPSLYSDEYDAGDVRDDGITNFISALNRLPAFEDIYRIQLNMARAKGLDVHTLFVDVGAWGKYGQWGHLEYPGQPLAQSVKWQSVIDFAADVEGLNPVESPVGTRPQFDTPAVLPLGTYNTPYTTEIVASGGEGVLTITEIGSLLLEGMRLDPVPGDPSRMRLSGTPLEGGEVFLYLRVVDGDGDPSWQVFSARIVGGPGNVFDADLRGTFAADTDMPWTKTHAIDPDVTWSGLGIGRAHSSSGGTATGTDSVGVRLFDDIDGIRFSVGQGGATEAVSTLASALADDEYFTFTVTPAQGIGLNLRGASFRIAWMREEYHAPRDFAVFSSVDGFTEPAAIYLMNATPSEDTITEHIFPLPDTAAYGAIAGPIEFRIYFYGSQYAHKARILGLGLTRASGATNGEISSGTPFTQSAIADRASQGSDTSGTAIREVVSQYSRYGVKFNIPSGDYTAATFRIFRATSSTTAIFSAYEIGDNWNESTNPETSSTLIASAGESRGDVWLEFDVTAYVQTQADTDQIASFLLKTNNSGWTNVHARENPTNPPELVLTPVATPSAYEIYAQDNGITGAPEEDDNGNGLSNFGEFAFGGHLLSANRFPPVRHSMPAPGSMDLTFYRRMDDALNYSVEQSGSLAPNGWTPAVASPIGDPVPVDGDYESVTWRIEISGQPHLFFRLRAEE